MIIPESWTSTNWLQQLPSALRMSTRGKELRRSWVASTGSRIPTCPAPSNGPTWGTESRARRRVSGPSRETWTGWRTGSSWPRPGRWTGACIPVSWESATSCAVVRSHWPSDVRMLALFKNISASNFSVAFFFINSLLRDYVYTVTPSSDLIDTTWSFATTMVLWLRYTAGLQWSFCLQIGHTASRPSSRAAWRLQSASRWPSPACRPLTEVTRTVRGSRGARRATPCGPATRRGR